MRLICLNDSCEHTAYDYEVRDVYTPECPVCWASMAPLGETPDPRRHELDREEQRRLADEDAFYAQRKQDSVPAEQYAMPAGTLFRRQA